MSIIDFWLFVEIVLSTKSWPSNDSCNTSKASFCNFSTFLGEVSSDTRCYTTVTPSKSSSVMVRKVNEIDGFVPSTPCTPDTVKQLRKTIPGPWSTSTKWYLHPLSVGQPPRAWRSAAQRTCSTIGGVLFLATNDDHRRLCSVAALFSTLSKTSATTRGMDSDIVGALQRTFATLQHQSELKSYFLFSVTLLERF